RSEPTTEKRPTSFGSYDNEDPFADRPPIKSPTLDSFGPSQRGTGAGVKT
ncbi:17007_t:CDS:1, partial [Acaulospora colombiana]